MVGATKVKATKETTFRNTIWMIVEIHAHGWGWNILDSSFILFSS